MYKPIYYICFLFIVLLSPLYQGAYVCALTTDEIILLKEHGVSERTIQLMIQSEAEAKKQSETSILISENESSVTYSTGKPSTTPLTREEKHNIEDAWDMLKNFSLEIEQ